MNFQSEVVAGGLSQPIAVSFPPDGNMLILQKTGQILRADLSATPAVVSGYMTITDIDSDGERGLIDITLDPDFATNNYFYVYYSRASTGRFRIARFVHDVDHAHFGDEFVVWEDNEPATTCCHFGGGLDFGPDGRLYLTTGEEFDAQQAQNLTRAGGKVIRINADGSIPADNPFADGPGGNLDEIWCLGLRNPFRARWDLPTNRLLIGEVGGNNQAISTEDLHVAEAGANFGWPLCEGDCDNPDFPLCDCGEHTGAIFSYPHGGAGASITGGVVYRGTQFPTSYIGTYFYGDYVRQWLRYLTFDAAGTVTGSFDFDPAAGPVVAIEEGPDGAVYYVLITGSVHRVVFDEGNQPAVITEASADTLQGVAPLAVNFTGAASDPDADPLTYRWVYGDGTEGDEASASHTYTANGVYIATLEVSDGAHVTRSVPLTIMVGMPPIVSLDEPMDGSLFRAGDQISFAGSATDPDGVLGDANYEWIVEFLHNEHLHPALGPLNGPTGALDIPTAGHDYSDNTRYRLTLTVTDGDGLFASQSVTVFPDKVDLTFDTDPSGLTIVLDSIPRVTPFVHDTLIGFSHEVSALLSQCVEGVEHTFEGWSDGAPADRIIVAPDHDESYTATYDFDPTPPECTLLYREDFGSYAAGTDPADWLDTAAGNSLNVSDEFKVFDVAGGRALGTSSGLINLHSHYAEPAAYAWSSYEFTGRMMFTNGGAGIGVTFSSDFPNTDRYYRLRRGNWSGGQQWHLWPHGTDLTGGITATNVTSVANQWYRFRIIVDDVGTRTEIKARVWTDGFAEPANWQIDCYDANPTRLTAGTIGVWSMSSGIKYWDDFEVVGLRCDGARLECDDGDVCNGAETCQGGICVAGESLACDDGNACNGNETCDPVLGCTAGLPLNCNDGDVCNGTETCDPVSGCVAGVPLDCDDDNACNGVETCDSVSGCQTDDPLDCDDGDSCTSDFCDPVAGCVNTLLASCAADVRIQPVVVTVDPATTADASVGDPPPSASTTDSHSVFWVEVWATDGDTVNSGITALYVDVAYCNGVIAEELGQDSAFDVLTGGTIITGGVDEFGGSSLPHGGGIEPEWVRIGWIQMRAGGGRPACGISLQPSQTGVGAFGRGLVPWGEIELGSVSISITSTSGAIDYDLDDDGFIGAGDLALLAQCWLCADNAACWAANGCDGMDVDCDGQVGPGDLAWFATGWQKAADEPGLEYPMCP